MMSGAEEGARHKALKFQAFESNCERLIAAEIRVGEGTRTPDIQIHRRNCVDSSKPTEVLPAKSLRQTRSLCKPCGALRRTVVFLGIFEWGSQKLGSYRRRVEPGFPALPRAPRFKSPIVLAELNHVRLIRRRQPCPVDLAAIVVLDVIP